MRALPSVLNKIKVNFARFSFTPLRIENAQSASSSSLITAPEGGVLNERRCKGGAKIEIYYKNIIMLIIFLKG